MFDFGLLTIFSTDSPNSATQVDCLSGLASCANIFLSDLTLTRVERLCLSRNT